MAGSYKPYFSLILIVVLYVAFSVSAISVLVFHLQPAITSNQNSSTPTVNILLFAGETSDNKMGFGTSANALTSPGPTLRFTLSDVVNLTIINVGKMPHAFAITEMPQTGAAVLFNAEVASSTNPLSPGQQASVIFSPNYAGSTFYYICPIPGHAEAGMWGSVIVTG
jgi:uncharacterized cupredoxin-like copper-binding protein